MPEPTLADLMARVDALHARLDSGPAGYLSAEAAATYCGCSLRTIRRALSRGDLTPVHPARGLARISRADVDRWLASTVGRRIRKGRGLRAEVRA